MKPLTRNLTAFTILFAAFLARWPFRSVPLIRDEGELAQLAQGLRVGVVPYLDLYNQKPPVAFSLIALVQGMAGESVEALRLATTAWFLLGGGGLFFVLRRWGSDGAALVALAAYCVMGVGQAGFFHQASTEVFTLPWLVLGLGLWLQARTTGGALPALGAGLAVALAYQTKQTAIALGVAMALDALLAASDRETRRTAAWALLGAALVTAGVAASLASAGALDAYLDATWRHNWAYVGARHLGEVPPLALPVDAMDRLLWYAGGLGLVALGIRARASPLRTVPLLGATALASAVLAGHDYAHYYVPLIVPLAAGLGLGPGPARGRVRQGVLAVALAVVFAPALWRIGGQARSAERATAAVLAQAPAVRDAERVAHYLAERTTAGEAIAILGSEPQVAFLADRPSTLRMPIFYPVSGEYPHSGALLAEVEERLLAAPPRYVAVADDWRSFAELKPRGQRLRRRFRQLLGSQYALDHHFEGSFQVLRRIEPPAPLLLLITTDTLRADHLGAYGSTASRTPALDALAAESLRFTASFAPAPYTMPSIAALHTGRYPEELGILANHALFRGIQATLAQRLQERGWRTGAVVSNYVLRRGTGIELGFERYDDDLPDTELNRDQPERVAADTTTAALSLLDDLLEAPAAGVFLWVHYQDPHGPYLPPDGLRERHLEAARDGADGRRELPVRGLNPVSAIPRYQAVGDEREIAFYRAGYAGEVEATDQEIGRLLAGVTERAPESPTTVLFTADHGESLGEDDYWFAHGRFLSDALVRVPLMIRTPGVEASVREDIVSLVDVMPTLLALAGDSEISSTSGRNLLADDSAHVAGQAYLANLMGAAKKRWGWVADGHVLIQEPGGNEVSLRSLRTGAPVADPARQAQMGDKLEAFRAALRVQPEVQQRLSPQDVKMLRQLGYFE
jgi:arylsulfatase